MLHVCGLPLPRAQTVDSLPTSQSQPHRNLALTTLCALAFVYYYCMTTTMSVGGWKLLARQETVRATSHLRIYKRVRRRGGYRSAPAVDDDDDYER